MSQKYREVSLCWLFRNRNPHLGGRQAANWCTLLLSYCGSFSSFCIVTKRILGRPWQALDRSVVQIQTSESWGQTSYPSFTDSFSLTASSRGLVHRFPPLTGDRRKPITPEDQRLEVIRMKNSPTMDHAEFKERCPTRHKHLAKKNQLY